jgi:hypothetical protein
LTSNLAALTANSTVITLLIRARGITKDFDDSTARSNAIDVNHANNENQTQYLQV